MDITIHLPNELGERVKRVPNLNEFAEQAFKMALVNQQVVLADWQIAKIQEGIEAADRGEFATDKEVEDFFAKWKHED